MQINGKITFLLCVDGRVYDRGDISKTRRLGEGEIGRQMIIILGINL